MARNPDRSLFPSKRKMPLVGQPRAFTLIELLMAITIIAALIGILFPALSAARARGVRTACSSNLRQIGIAMRSYLDASNDIYPFASFMPSIDAFPVPSGQTIYIADLLFLHAPDPKVFACPMDQGQMERTPPNEGQSYFSTEKSSYEYRSSFFGGQTMEAVLRRVQDFLGRRPPENTIWIMRDYDNFHGRGGTEGSRRYLYNDGHVTDYE